jgi:thiol-disulfide isomerase/thioredoxin
MHDLTFEFDDPGATSKGRGWSLPAVLLLAFTSACSTAPSDPDALPSLTGKTLGGDYWSLTDEAGKVVLVNVWATWCAPCRNELPVLAGIQRRLGGPDFTVIGVSIDKATAEDEVRSMASQYGLGYPIVLDPSKRVSVDWEVNSYPTSFLLDRKSHLVSRHRGELKSNDTKLEESIQRALEDAP